MELITYQGLLYLLILCHEDLMYFWPCNVLMLADMNRLTTSLTINQNIKPGASWNKKITKINSCLQQGQQPYAVGLNVHFTKSESNQQQTVSVIYTKCHMILEHVLLRDNLPNN